MSKINSNLNVILEKLGEMKKLFHYGEKIVPIIESITQFVDETMPLLDNVNSSIVESTHKMPQASNQINDVTSATELATTEILDLIDEINNEIENTKNQLNKIKTAEIESLELLEKLKAVVNENPAALKYIDELTDKLPVYESVDKIMDNIAKIEDASYKITLSLQVQDITTQQLAAVNHLISSVHERLNNLLQDFGDYEMHEEQLEKELASGQHFDANAKYGEHGKKQSDIDKIIEEQQKTSQDEIDKLFS